MLSFPSGSSFGDVIDDTVQTIMQMELEQRNAYNHTHKRVAQQKASNPI